MFKTFDFDNADGTNKGLLKEYAPQIRHEALFQGLNKLLMKIEFLVGLAYGTLSAEKASDLEQIQWGAEIPEEFQNEVLKDYMKILASGGIS